MVTYAAIMRRGRRPLGTVVQEHAVAGEQPGKFPESSSSTMSALSRDRVLKANADWDRISVKCAKPFRGVTLEAGMVDQEAHIQASLK